VKAGSSRAAIVRAAALEGAALWTAVAIAERLLGWLLVQSGLLHLLPAHPPMAALAWYPAAGLASGVAAGLLAGGDPATRVRRVRTLVLLSVVAAFAVAGAVSAQTLTSRLALALCVLAGLTLLLQLREPRGRLGRMLDGSSPATVAVLLSLPAWHRLNVPFPEARVSYSTVIVLIGVAAVVAHAVTTFIRARARRRAVPPALRAAVALAILMAIIAAAERRVSPATAGAASSPDVVLVVLDTVRADHLAAYGYARNTMPGLDEFARQSTVYTNAVAAADMTLSSHASMFTGVYPFRHGAYVRVANPVGLPMNARYPTIAEALAGRGYRTCGIAANWSFLGPVYGFHRGFDRYEWDPSSSVHVLERLGLAMQFGFSPPPYAPATRVTDKAIAAIASADGRPLHLFVNYLDAHMPNAPPESFLDAVERMPLPEGIPTPLAGGRLSPDELRSRIDWYDASLAFVDRELSRLFDHLRTTGRYDNALVIVTSDHGELLGEDGLYGHGRGTADALIRVPIIVKFPGQRTPSRVDDLVSHVDLAPTVFAVVGAEPLIASDGIDLRAASARRPHPVISMSFPEGSGFETAVYTSAGKIVILPSGSIVRTIGGTPMLNPPIPEADRALVDSLIASANGMAPLGESQLTPEARERLRALGYIR
jgi:arylsulfatase A-like enzyme